MDRMRYSELMIFHQSAKIRTMLQVLAGKDKASCSFPPGDVFGSIARYCISIYEQDRYRLQRIQIVREIHSNL